MAWFDIIALASLLVYYGTIIWKILQKKKNGYHIIAVGRGKKGIAKYIEYSFVIGVFALALLLLASMPSVNILNINLFVIFESTLTYLIGSILVVSGALFFLWSAISMKSAFRMGIDIDKTYTLITNGAFKLSRNPTYVSMWLLFLGYFILYANFFFLGTLIFMIFALEYQIRKEETLLSNLFKDEYLEYRKKTPKYLIFK